MNHELESPCVHAGEYVKFKTSPILILGQGAADPRNYIQRFVSVYSCQCRIAAKDAKTVPTRREVAYSQFFGSSGE